MKDEFNAIDRFLYKFIICLILLVSIVFLDKIKVININEVKQSIQYNINFLKIFKYVNGDQGVFLPLDINDEIAQSVSINYENYELISGGKRIFLDEMQGVEAYKAGIVIKIFQNDDSTYQVTIKGIDDFEYVYDKLESSDLNIYKIVKSGEIIGNPTNHGSKTYFDFYQYK